MTGMWVCPLQRCGLCFLYQLADEVWLGEVLYISSDSVEDCLVCLVEYLLLPGCDDMLSLLGFVVLILFLSWLLLWIQTVCLAYYCNVLCCLLLLCCCLVIRGKSGGLSSCMLTS